MENQSIILFSCAPFEDDLTDRLVVDLEREFHFPVIIEECHTELSIWYNPVRRQYDANGLLSMISGMNRVEAIKTMGLFRVDLYIPILTYIFGQAVLNGNSGIVSIYRLRNELYGLKKDHNLLCERFSKVVMHEMGHAFGLIHCHNPICIMRPSTYVEDIDQKEGHFCRNCKEAIENQTRKG